MSDEMEKISITVADTRGSCTRIITDEYEVSDTCWPHLVEVFLEQLQGLGYGYVSTPEKMAEVLNEFHDRCVHEKYACKEEMSTVEERKYPYTGIIQNKDGVTIVEFTSKNIGKCIYSIGHEGNVAGQFNSNWDEDLFEKVSK